MATGMPVTISARNEVSSVPVMVFPPEANFVRLPRRGPPRPWGGPAGAATSFDGLLDRVFRPLEQAEAAPPVLDRHLDRAECGERESECAHAVDDVHRQVDDR